MSKVSVPLALAFACDANEERTSHRSIASSVFLLKLGRADSPGAATHRPASATIGMRSCRSIRLMLDGRRSSRGRRGLPTRPLLSFLWLSLQTWPVMQACASDYLTATGEKQKFLIG